jgi:N-acyl-D-amino-acid deacylase
MKKTLARPIQVLLATILLAACTAPTEPEHFDVIIRGGDVYDGLGGAPVAADVALNDDRIAKIGDLSAATAEQDIDASGLAVSPGFINMLSWATESLIEDGRGGQRLASTSSFSRTKAYRRTSPPMLAPPRYA